MAAFPTLMELLIPNLNFTTVLGIVLVAVGILGFAWLKGATDLLKTVGLNIDAGKISVLIILAGLILIWGVSIFQDFVNSPGGAAVFFGSIVVIVFAFLLFWEPKKKGGNKQNLIRF